MSARKRLCPQCKIHRFMVKNDAGDTVVVTVTAEFEIIPIHPEQSLESFDLGVLYCLGCSWKGSPARLSL
jgi:hypothetical protein